MKRLYVLCILLFLTIRLVGIGNDISNSDALRWHRRSENFLTALKALNLKETYQHYQPGVTLMWIDAVVKQFSTWLQLTYTSTPKTLEMAEFYPIGHGISKGALVVITGLLLLFQVYCINRLFNKKTALIYVFLISVEPYIIGLNRWFHLTSLEVFFAYSSIFSLLVWHKEMTDAVKTKHKDFSVTKFLLVSSLFFTLSVLSKTSTLILIPVYLLVFWQNFTKHRKYQNIFIFVFSAIFFALLFFPALTANPLYVFSRVYRSLRLAVTEDAGMFNLAWYYSPFYYLLILLFKMSPITLVLSCVSIWHLRRSKDFNVKVIFSVLIVYYVFLSLSSKKIDRYSLAFFPSLLLLTAIYLAKLNFKIQTIICGFSLLFLSYVIYIYHPVYSAYYSPLFGGTKTAIKLQIYDNSGEYYAQAAQFLNAKGRDVITYVPNNFDSFSPFYVGKFQTGYNENVNYAVYSLDSERPTLDSTLPCYSTNLNTKTVQSFAEFGPKDYSVIFVFACR